VLCGVLAGAYRTPWLATTGAVLAILGASLITVVLVRFDPSVSS
jgi:hypothetical protein